MLLLAKKLEPLSTVISVKCIRCW